MPLVRVRWSMEKRSDHVLGIRAVLLGVISLDTQSMPVELARRWVKHDDAEAASIRPSISPAHGKPSTYLDESFPKSSIVSDD